MFSYVVRVFFNFWLTFERIDFQEREKDYLSRDIERHIIYPLMCQLIPFAFHDLFLKSSSLLTIYI